MAFADNPRLIFSAANPGGQPRVLNSAGINEIAEASGQSFKKGQFVYDSSGITAVASDPSSVLGIAMEDAVGTGYATNYPEVEILGPGDILEISYTDTTGAATPTIGTAYGLAVASNECKLDIDETTTKLFRVVKIIDTTAKRCVVTLVNSTSLWQWYVV